jgi:hypothetical protein
MKDKFRQVSIQFRLELELMAALEAASISSKKSKEKIIRIALKRYLAKLPISTEPENNDQPLLTGPV